jgi:hypothetical protein
MANKEKMAGQQNQQKDNQKQQQKPVQHSDQSSPKTNRTPNDMQPGNKSNQQAQRK